MSEDKRKGTKDFLAGKGFYVILFACVAVIGISAWILLFTGNTGGSDDSDMSEVMSEFDNMQDVMKEEPGLRDSEDVFSKQESDIKQPEIKQPEVKQEPKSEQKTEETPAPTPSEKPAAVSNNTEGHESSAVKQKTIEEMTFVWPVAGKVENPFSVDMPVYNRTLAVWKVHTGVDIAAAIGTKVLAVTEGKVVDIYDDDMMGTTVVIDHGNKLMSKYSNLAATPVVKKGDNIAMGAVVGAVGNTALGEIGEVAHLHLEMSLDGDAVDPVGYLPTR